MMYKTFSFLTVLVVLCQHSLADAAARNPQLRPRNRSARFLIGVHDNADTEGNGGVPRTPDTSHRRLARDRITLAPTVSAAPSVLASPSPSVSPTAAPSAFPSDSPTFAPTSFPSNSPSSIPSVTPSKGPTQEPSSAPSKSMYPSVSPSTSHSPVESPSSAPSTNPTMSNAPTSSHEPTAAPNTATPTSKPSTSQPSVRPIATTQSPTDMPTNSVVALLGFSLAITANDTAAVNQDELTTTLEEYLTDGMLEAYSNAVAVTLQLRTSSSLRRQQRQLQESSSVDYSGFIVFSGTAPALKDVQDLQQELMQDTAQVQTALDANPSIGDSVVVEKVAFDAKIIDGKNSGGGGGDDDDDNNAAIIGGVVGGSVLTLAVVALLITRRRSNPLDDDDDDESVPPPPPPRQEPRDVTGDLQGASKTTINAVPENMDPIVPPPVSPNRAKQTDVDYDLQPSANAAPMPAGAAAYVMRTTTPNKAQVNANEMVAISPITPARSVDSDDMDGYSLGGGEASTNLNAASAYTPVKNKSTTAAISEESDEDEYNSDNDESMFTYGNVGEDTSVLGAGASVFADTVAEDDEESVEPGHLTIKKSASGQTRYVQPYPTKTDNADVAAGRGNSKPDDSGQPFDEANDDMDQDLDAFAAELERAKAAAKSLKISDSSSPSSVKSDFAKNRDAFEKSSKAKTIGRAPVMES